MAKGEKEQRIGDPRPGPCACVCSECINVHNRLHPLCEYNCALAKRSTVTAAEREALVQKLSATQRMMDDHARELATWKGRAVLAEAAPGTAEHLAGEYKAKLVAKVQRSEAPRHHECTCIQCCNARTVRKAACDALTREAEDLGMYPAAPADAPELEDFDDGHIVHVRGVVTDTGETMLRVDFGAKTSAWVPRASVTHERWTAAEIADVKARAEEIGREIGLDFVESVAQRPAAVQTAPAVNACETCGEANSHMTCLQDTMFCASCWGDFRQGRWNGIGSKLRRESPMPKHTQEELEAVCASINEEADREKAAPMPSQAESPTCTRCNAPGMRPTEKGWYACNACGARRQPSCIELRELRQNIARGPVAPETRTDLDRMLGDMLRTALAGEQAQAAVGEHDIVMRRTDHPNERVVERSLVAPAAHGPGIAPSCEIELFEDDEHNGEVRWWRKYADDGDFVATVALCDHHHDDAQDSDLGVDLRPDLPCLSEAADSSSKTYADGLRRAERIVRDAAGALLQTTKYATTKATDALFDAADRISDEAAPFTSATPEKKA